MYSFMLNMCTVLVGKWSSRTGKAGMLGRTIKESMSNITVEFQVESLWEANNFFPLPPQGGSMVV